MADKVSKTARASMGKVKKETLPQCPECAATDRGETRLVATKVIKHRGTPGGMYWACPDINCHYRRKI